MIRVVACLDRPPAESGRVVTDMPRSVYQFRYTDRFVSKSTKSNQVREASYARARARETSKKISGRAVAFEHYVMSPRRRRDFFSFFFSFRKRSEATRAKAKPKLRARCIGHSQYRRVCRAARLCTTTCVRVATFDAARYASFAILFC
jgi:adenylate kinase family enzyme